MKNLIRSLVVVFVCAVPQTVEAFTDMVCGLASRTVSASILGVVATSGGPTAVLTGLTAASAAALGCRLIVSRATPAIIATLAATVGPFVPGQVGTWIAATAASSAVAPPIGAAIMLGAVVGTAGTLLVVHACTVRLECLARRHSKCPYLVDLYQVGRSYANYPTVR